MNNFLVTITMVNKKGNVIEEKIETDSKVGVSRIILTFKAKRNYEIVDYLVTPTVTLI